MSIANFFMNLFNNNYNNNQSSNTTSNNVVIMSSYIISNADLQKLFPNLSADKISNFVKSLNVFMPKYGLTTVEQWIMFLSQTAYESANYSAIEENLNYSANALLATWPSRFTTITSIQCARQPEKIANLVYANRLGNGNEASGDGWKYRGRGLIQLTGKANYQAFSNDINQSLDDCVVYMSSYDGAVECSCWYWKENNLGQYTNYSDVEKVTKIINGGTLGLAQRQQNWTAFNKILNG
jgi:putative chitinase